MFGGRGEGLDYRMGAESQKARKWGKWVLEPVVRSEKGISIG